MRAREGIAAHIHMSITRIFGASSATYLRVQTGFAAKWKSSAAAPAEAVVFNSQMENNISFLLFCLGLRADFQAFEILAKPWGACISRPTPDQRKHQDDIEEGDAFYHLKAEKKSEQGAQGGQVQQPAPFRDLLSHFLQPPSSKPVSNPGSSLLQETEAAAVDVRRKNTLHISSYHYQMPMKGHTGYVAYCVRPSEDEEVQPLP